MKREEFVTGLLFMMPGSGINGKVFQVQSIGEKENVASGISTYGWIHHEKFVPARMDDAEFWHLKFMQNGIKLWQVAGTVYLHSKLIPFKDMRKVELPAPAELESATQSQTI